MSQVKPASMLHSVLGRETQTLWDLGHAALPLHLVAVDDLNGGQRRCTKDPTTKARRTYVLTIVTGLLATSCCTFLDRDIHSSSEWPWSSFRRLMLLFLGLNPIPWEYCDLSDRPVPTISEFVPSKDQTLMFREKPPRPETRSLR